jgi:hypothetical protein
MIIVSLLVCLWYAISSLGNSFANRTVLSVFAFGFPFIMLLVQFLVNISLAPLLRVLCISEKRELA